jgi:hypothetical protein
MSLISRAQFERRLTVCLEKIERGLANRARQKTGYAWRLIVDHMYNGPAPDIACAAQQQDSLGLYPDGYSITLSARSAIDCERRGRRGP